MSYIGCYLLPKQKSIVSATGSLFGALDRCTLNYSPSLGPHLETKTLLLSIRDYTQSREVGLDNFWLRAKPTPGNYYSLAYD
jgi:hypothetical protein